MSYYPIKTAKIHISETREDHISRRHALNRGHANASDHQVPYRCPIDANASTRRLFSTQCGSEMDRPNLQCFMLLYFYLIMADLTLFAPNIHEWMWGPLQTSSHYTNLGRFFCREALVSHASVLRQSNQFFGHWFKIKKLKSVRHNLFHTPEHLVFCDIWRLMIFDDWWYLTTDDIWRLMISDIQTHCIKLDISLNIKQPLMISAI